MHVSVVPFSHKLHSEIIWASQFLFFKILLLLLLLLLLFYYFFYFSKIAHTEACRDIKTNIYLNVSILAGMHRVSSNSKCTTTYWYACSEKQHNITTFFDEACIQCTCNVKQLTLTIMMCMQEWQLKQKTFQFRVCSSFYISCIFILYLPSECSLI